MGNGWRCDGGDRRLPVDDGLCAGDLMMIPRVHSVDDKCDVDAQANLPANSAEANNKNLYQDLDGKKSSLRQCRDVIEQYGIER